MSNTIKWFDLSEYGAKLERRETGGGHYKLMLELGDERLEPLLPAPGEVEPMAEALLRKGWMMEAVGADRYLLTNHQAMHRKSEVVESLRPFFTAQEIEDAHVPLDLLRQGEVVDGLEVRTRISVKELHADIAGVEPEDLDRITQSVLKAQKLQEARLQQSRAVSFDGRGVEIFNYLTDRLVAEKGFDEQEAAMAVLLDMDAAANRGAQAARFNYLGQAIGSGIEADIRAQSEFYLEGRSREEWTEHQQKMLLTHVYEMVKKRYSEAPESDLNRPRDAVLGLLSDDFRKLTAAAMSAVEMEPHETEQVLSERLPFRVLRDNSVPTKNLIQNLKAANAVLDLVAEELDLPRDKLVPQQDSIPLRFSYDAVSVDEDAGGFVANADRGQASDVEEVREKALVMNVSVQNGRTFVHELGHIIDLGNGLSAEDRHDILLRSGVLPMAQQAIDAIYPDDEDRRKYYGDEKEIFARAFEAHFANVLRDRGDMDLKAVGGQQTMAGFDLAAPYGDLETTGQFVSALKQVLDLKKDAAHEKAMAAESDLDAESENQVSFGLG